MPENIKIQKLTCRDVNKLKQLLSVFENVFEWASFTPPPEKHLHKMLESPQHLVFTALLNGMVIGGLTAYLLDEFETETSIVYIYDLAVKTEYQRQGIGQQLVKGIADYCRQQKNITEVFVQADEEDEYAVDFYRKTGGKEMKVAQFTYRL